MKLKLKRWIKGERPKASDLNRLAEALERVANLTVASGSGLDIQESASGTVLSLVAQGQVPRRAIVTQTITTPTSATATHTASRGWGFARLQRWDNSLNKYVSYGDPVKVINPWPSTSATATATVGLVIFVVFSDGVWQLLGENCP